MKESFGDFNKNRQNDYEALLPRVVGDASEELKQKTQEHFHNLFYEKHLSDLPKEKLEELLSLEYDKNQTEAELIEAADNDLKDIMARVGVGSFNVPAKNIHMVPLELFKKINRTGGDAITSNQHRAVFLDAEKYRNNPLDFGKTIFHELFHLRGHLAVEVEEKGDEGETTIYRSGITAFSSQKKEDEYKGHKHFDGLEEGLAGELERRYFKKLIEHPVLRKQKEQLESEAIKEAKEKISKSRNIPIEEINNVKENGDFSTFSYPFHRKVLNLITSEIYKKNKDEFESEDEVLDIFIKAHFDGKLLPMSRLVANVFGKDTLRIISMMSDKKDSAAQTLEFLEKKIAKQDLPKENGRLARGELENQKTEKEKNLEKIINKIEKTVDGAGLEIDEKIKETVVLFNALGIKTAGSCEGHFDWGMSAPWIDIEAENEPEYTYKIEKETYEKVARKHNLTINQIKHPTTKEENNAWKEVWNEINGMENPEETEEYKKWSEENLKLYNKVKTLLDDFYKDRDVEPDCKIIAPTERARHGFRVHNGGENFQLVIKEGKKPNKKEQEFLAEKLKKYQKEMREFANFLKKQYLKNKF